MFQKMLQLPYRLMQKFADGHNNTNDYTKMHANAWFVGLILMLCVSILAWRADYEVLFGLDFNSSGDSASAFWKAMIFASVIQILILVSGGMFVKIWINDLHCDREHRIQFWIHLGLFSIGFFSTLYLSFNTDKAAKAQAFDRTQELAQAQKSQLDSVQQQAKAQLEELQKQTMTQKKNIQVHYDSTTASIRRFWQAKREEKQAEFSAGKIAKDVLSQKLKSYTQQEQNALLQQEQARKKELLQDESSFRAEKQAIQWRWHTQDSVQAQHYGRLFSELHTDIAHNGEATRYKNVLLNFIGFILCVGTLFFARGANAQGPQCPVPDGTGGRDYRSTSLKNSADQGNSVSLAPQTERNNLYPPYQNCGNSPKTIQQNREKRTAMLCRDAWAFYGALPPAEKRKSKIVSFLSTKPCTKIELADQFEDWDKQEQILFQDGIPVLFYTKRNGNIVQYKPSDIKRIIRTYQKRKGEVNARRVNQWEQRLARIEQAQGMERG